MSLADILLLLLLWCALSCIAGPILGRFIAFGERCPRSSNGADDSRDRPQSPVTTHRPGHHGCGSR